MSFDLSGFDAEQVEDNKDFGPIPSGDYEAVISASENKENSKKTGTFLKVEFTIVSGPYANRKLWVNLNLNNPNEQAVKIAMGELKAICYAVGVLKPAASSDLHDIPMILKVGMKKRGDTGELENQIKGYKSKSGQAAPPSVPSAPQAQPPKPAPVAAGAGTAPWKR